ncbi:DUF2264 domain-containing protein [Actinoplanes sp. NPDC051513]|uniref:DUF2264 domain-containing protein n=1 Tax=Actinoplanes sp. NPDC051513 TaxID=3363908 RepID=UPI0037AADC40
MSENSADWSRDDWVRLADRMLAAARRHASPGHARITFPGPVGGYGRAIDGLEGFARTFLLAGFRIAGERGHGMDELADRYAKGLATGTDPHAPEGERWPRLDEHAQAKVEAASIALILDQTRPWIWDRLDESTRHRVVDYLSPAVGDDTYPRINWVWFRLVVQTFLRSVGGPWSGPEMVADLATHDSFHRADGWLADGPARAFDHYTGWALHTYPVLWARMTGAADLAASRRARDVAALDRYLADALALVGADGSPLIQGRSLAYRFAAAAPFWAGILAGVPTHSPGALRHAADRIVRHFADRGAPDADGLLPLGWHRPWPRLAQSYSGPGSPYWASKGLLGLALPADHPVWTAPAEPLPIETGDYQRIARAPGWLITGCKEDGVVRVVNHGTDHNVEGATTGDSPLYARIGYSTATAPVLDESGWTDPLDQSVVLIDAEGRRTHRTGMTTLVLRHGVAGSASYAHWVKADPAQPDHGAGRCGIAEPAGRITVLSLVRGPWELRLARVDEPAPAAERLRIGGWAVTRHHHSHLVPVLGEGTQGHDTHDDGPLGGPVTVPWLDHPVLPGVWVAALIALSTEASPPRCEAQLTADDVEVTWPDGVRTSTPLTKEKG